MLARSFFSNPLLHNAATQVCVTLAEDEDAGASDDQLEAEVMEFCRHLTRQNGEQMGAAKITIELCEEVGRDSARHIERMANSALMLNPAYQAQIAQYIAGVGKKGD